MPIDTMAIVGTGIMGRGIAQIAALSGLRVLLHDARAGAASEAREFVADQLQRLVEKGRIPEASQHAALHQLRPVDALAGLAGAELVVEAIVEDLGAKCRLFAELETLLPEETILATNTSSLTVTAIAAACRRPQRVAGLHFFNPVPMMKLVEVIAGLRTDPGVADELVRLVDRLGHAPVRAGDLPGFLVNHAGRGYFTEALRLLQEGVADAAAIDRVLRDGAGFPLGPFELLDLTGLDVSDPVMRTIYHGFYEEPRFRPSPSTRQRMTAGLLGRKSGRGWYVYEAGRKVEPLQPDPPADRPKRVWVSRDDEGAGDRLSAMLGRRTIAVESGGRPHPEALCLVTPMGDDVTTACTQQHLDPARTLGVDMLIDEPKRWTLAANPLTSAAMRRAAQGLLSETGRPTTLIADSPGFVVQRVLATIINIAAEIAQQRIAWPGDIDAAVRLALGYPHGPLAWGDRLGPCRVLRILGGLCRATGDPRYRPSLWLRRRAMLGISLSSPELAD